MYLDDQNARAMTGGRVVVGVLFGAAVGATLGLIFAPRSGHETRRRLSESGERLRQNANDTYQRAATTVGDVVDSGRAAVARSRDAFVRAREQVADRMPEHASDGVAPGIS